MAKKYKVIFSNKTLLALCLLEIHAWHAQGKPFTVDSDNEKLELVTTSADIVDIVTESIGCWGYSIEIIK